MKAAHDMGWIKEEGAGLEAGRLPDGMQELGAQIDGGRAEVWSVKLGC